VNQLFNKHYAAILMLMLPIMVYEGNLDTKEERQRLNKWENILQFFRAERIKKGEWKSPFENVKMHFEWQLTSQQHYIANIFSLCHSPLCFNTAG
jgi:hypothetical protein